MFGFVSRALPVVHRPVSQNRSVEMTGKENWRIGICRSGKWRTKCRGLENGGLENDCITRQITCTTLCNAYDDNSKDLSGASAAYDVRQSPVVGTDVLLDQIAYLFVPIGIGQTTFLKAIIPACVAEFESVIRTELIHVLTHLRNVTADNMSDLQRVWRGLDTRHPKNKGNPQNDTLIKACTARCDVCSYTMLQFLRAMSHGVLYTSTRCYYIIDVHAWAPQATDSAYVAPRFLPSRPATTTMTTATTSSISSSSRPSLRRHLLNRLMPRSSVIFRPQYSVRHFLSLSFYNNLYLP